MVESINREHHNHLFLPDAPLADNLRAGGEIAEVVRGAEVIVSAAPSHVVRAVMTPVAAAMSGRPLVVSVSKGLEPDRLSTPCGVLREVLPAEYAAGGALGAVVRPRGL